MRGLVRLFFRTLRFVLIPFMLLWEKVTTPKGVIRELAEQKKVDEQTRAWVIYQFKTCPFCIKVRRELARLSLKIALLDAQHDEQHRADLLQGGGVLQVPCLKYIDEHGETKWLYESSAINAFLQQKFEIK